MFGSYCLKAYSSTQDMIALSSGEAEVYGIVRAGSLGLGLVGLCQDLGLKVSFRSNTGSSAAKSIGSRRGVGQVRHLDVRELWLQERVGRGDMVFREAPGAEKLADILTKHVPTRRLGKHMAGFGVVRVLGRRPLNPSLRWGEGGISSRSHLIYRFIIFVAVLLRARQGARTSTPPIRSTSCTKSTSCRSSS